MTKEISALIPAYNEGDRIGDIVNTIRSSSLINRIYVVDDGSNDDTAIRAGEAGAKVLKLSKNRGKGFALKYGLDRIIDKNDIIVFLDGDLEATRNDIDMLIEPVLKNDCDVTIAKFLPAKKRGGFGFVKGLAKSGIKFYTKKEIDSGLSGQRAFKSEVLKNFTKMPYRYGIEVGMTIDVLNLGYSIKEVEVKMKHRESGRDVKGFIHRGKQFYQILWTLISKGVV